MTIKRRDFLTFIGGIGGAMLLDVGSRDCSVSKFSMPFMGAEGNSEALAATSSSQLNFKPIKGPMPLITDAIAPSKQSQFYRTFEVADDLVLPEGFVYDVIAAWGDPVGDSRFGYNNDYLSLIETSANEGYLTVNFEYISSIPWEQSYAKVIGKNLPFDEVDSALKALGTKDIDAWSLAANDPLKAKIELISKEALIDLGIGIISVRRTSEGKWVRTNSKADRRITGISGLDDGRYLKTTGAAVTIFRKEKGLGYTDKIGDRIIGTFNNCAGGTTPWGTVFSAEENFQDFVPEPVMPDGTSLDPSKKKFIKDSGDLNGVANVFGLAGNKYGWMVEIDPANPDDYGTKHTWLGRYRHEAVGIRAEADKPLVFYSGCDRRGGHLYKFVSKGLVNDPKDKGNSQLLESGMLYAAKFNADGTGSWIALEPSTPINPHRLDVLAGKMLPLPQRPAGGIFRATKEEEISEFKSKFKTLGDLYVGSDREKQGAILIDAHYAANAIGATCAARPEDTKVAIDGSLFITFTSGAASDSDGSPDLRIFKGADGKAYEYGWIMRLNEQENQPNAMNFQWSMIATGGEPTEGGLGFANPDNLAIDRSGHLWMVTDISTDKYNLAIPSRKDKSGKCVSQSDLRGLYGNSSIWFLPTSGADIGKAFLFGFGPMECETTGPFFSSDQQTLFLAVQHPGEIRGTRKDLAFESRQFAMRTTDGKEFMQTRKVPIGSNWPSLKPNDSPKPAVVAIRKISNSSI
ncbi:alkaline phosphatase PhoX [Pseudanabaena galeata UHCC 0370]|uniref:Alkaline phosphatase PhoX n=1 Tax=Pseudanabaena galeata UHCC 0370 TaxID=3110310 RepID=A0ABU5TJY8_9CYAN|nr:alkaline phosphatase PhoX [Pseudanabaena galeata]MEA5478515.1 alkaline phosphatase PhoX [Pseudanabaena galeata UHCC 0370]